jgi:hypothetical protein
MVGVGGVAVAGNQEHPDVVVERAADFTPHIASSTSRRPQAFAVAQMGDTVYVGGRFDTVQNANRTVDYSRSNIVAFDAETGAIRSFSPNIDGDVWSLEASPDGLYVGGRFKNIDGVRRPAIAKLDLVTGAMDTTFDPAFKSGRVSEIKLVDGKLFIGGSFNRKLDALNPVNGRPVRNQGVRYMDVTVAGSLPLSTDKVEVFKFSVNSAGTRLVGVGNFTTINGVNRQRAFMLNLDSAGATLSDWYYAPLDRRCRTQTGNRIAYLQDVDFAPDGSYFVFASTGFIPQTTAEIGTAICDAAARFETNNLAPVQPTWINYTGGDTLHSVEVTGAAVYVSGHSRWLDNPYGVDSPGPGAVDRPGGGSIDPVTGKANDWDPIQRNRTGGYNFLATDAGLWHVSDGQRFAGRYHRGIVFTPLP